MTCVNCFAVHDLDRGPDEGTCLDCGGTLQETPGEVSSGLYSATKQSIEAFVAWAQKQGAKVSVELGDPEDQELVDLRKLRTDQPLG